ncbi:unnamed protein product [Paramecium pentaurelia]|uniref:Uncharacterized protein n=1 Tax=Paramecium pentaurelia TaxID=43138 RepID=A0A8S1VVD4_9CILI|nr:unnamed protein product [Paramecium pentaurelia]
MNPDFQILQGIYQFQSQFSKIIKGLQDEANKYNKCFNQAQKDIQDFYNKLSQSSQKMNKQQINNDQEQQQQCDKSLKTLKNKYIELSKQLNIFNENFLQYQMQKSEFDNYYQQIQLSQIVQERNTPLQTFSWLITSPLQLDVAKQLTSQLSSIIQQQNLQFNNNEQLSNFFCEQTINIQKQIEQLEQQKILKAQIELQEQQKLAEIEEHKRQQQEIQKQKEELEQKNDIDNEQIDNFENLSETEELTQQCQECGQIIKFNNFLTQCLHYYHEECIIQKIKANYQKRSIYCSCNTLINSRMIKDVLEHSKKDQNQLSFETFQYYQIKQLLKKSNKNITECKCGFLYISEKEEQIDICIECDKCF